MGLLLLLFSGQRVWREGLMICLYRLSLIVCIYNGGGVLTTMLSNSIKLVSDSLRR